MKVLLLLSLALSAGCSSSVDESAVIDLEKAPGAGKVQQRGNLRLARDMRLLQSFSLELKDLEKEMRYLQAAVGMKERGYYTSDEHDKIENVLFRFLVCRESLWEMIDYYRNYRDHFPDEQDQVRGFILGFDAALHLAYYSSLLVATFLDDDVVIEKLNEEYYRSNIPEGTYNTLFQSLTKIENIEALKTAWELYSAELADQDSILFKISHTEPDYRRATDEVLLLHNDVDERIQYILEKRSLLLPNVRNRLRHLLIVELAKEAKDKLGDNLYAARGILFENVSSIKLPIAVNIQFSREQIDRMKKLLRPGDIILTFSAGYMSNVFLPGKFKHGITYVGMPADRKQAGLSRIALPGVPEEKLEKLKADLKIARLESGEEADLIEAVAEGVVFNSLEEITREHIARLCVLRPRLAREEAVDALTNVFLLLGDGYDFKFDFTDGSYQCCTEVIYRSLHKHGPIQFDLIKRMGTWTLCADDIIYYYLSGDQKTFDFVLYAEESPDSKGKAVLLTDAAGKQRLVSLMNGD